MSRPDPREALVVAGVSAYLLAVGGWLRLSRQIKPASSLAAICAVQARGRARSLTGRLLGKGPTGELGPCWQWRGHCYVAWLPWWARDAENDDLGHSRLRLFEDGRELGPAHANHDAIAAHGLGGYSHWHGYVRFSSSDGSDPRSNGRRYTFSLE